MSFSAHIQTSSLLFDGATTTRLYKGGLLKPNECPEFLNITRPLDVLDIHLSYVHAGADVITANTFGANELRLLPFGLDARAEELVQSGVTLCKEAIEGYARKVYVAASIGPTGELYQGDPRTPGLMYDSFCKQCSAAAAAGADLILIETMSDVCEARLALLAARSSCSLPVLCSFTPEADDHTYAGNPPEVLALYTGKLGASLCGVNCGFGPQELLPAYLQLAASSALPTFALPNALAADGGVITPGDMANAMLPYLHSGASAIGGCCGADETHIRELRLLLDQFHGHARHAAAGEECICSPFARVPLHVLEPYTPINLEGMRPEAAQSLVLEASKSQAAVHIDFGSWSGEAIRAYLFHLTPQIPHTPLAFHISTARQANAALFAYPGIAAIYAHGDTYRVMKAAARYGAEVIL